MTRAGRSHDQARRFWLACLCALCLLGLQGIGQWHGVVHGNKLIQQVAKTETVKTSGSWGHHSGDADCRFLDHLSHNAFIGSSVTVDAAALAHLKPTTPTWAGAEIAAHWKRGARAPPLSA